MDKRTWKHLNFFQYQTQIHASIPRIQCNISEQTETAEIPWVRSGSGFTLLMEAFTLELGSVLPLTQTEKITGINDNSIFRIISHYVTKARKMVDMSSVTILSVDETSKAKGHDYISVFTDLKQKAVLFACEGKDNSVFKEFCQDLEAH